MDIVFGTKWFERHQSKLLWLLNAPIIKYWFRWVMRIDCKDKINQITPNSYSFNGKYIDSDIIEITTDFRTHDKYSKRLYFAFKPMWWAMHALDWIALDRVEALTKLSFGFSTLTVYPNAGTSIDGWIHYAPGGGQSWATVQGAATGSAADTADTVEDAGCRQGSGNYEIYRIFTLFDTSALTSGATISATVYSLYVTQVFDQDDDAQGYVAVVTTSPASNTTLATADYDAIGTTEQHDVGQRKDLTGMSTGAYLDWTFNATGIGNVSKTSISKFGVREGHDLENSAIANASLNRFRVSSSRETGTGQDPKLVVTYTTSVAYTLTTSVSAFTLTTVNANIKRGWAVIASATAYTLTAIDALITRAHLYVLTTAVTAYNLTTQNALITKMWNIATSATAYTLTTVNAIITKGWNIATTSTAYTLTTKTIRLLMNGVSTIYTYATKNSTSYSGQSKNSTSFNNQSKNTTTWTNIDES